MQPNDDIELLRHYAKDGYEPAFAALVERHVNLVYFAALRQVNDPHLAEEVSQIVFLILAKKAGNFGDKVVLSGWLYRTARFAARDALKSRRRREQREQEAFQMDHTPSDPVWAQIAPFLDEAMDALGEQDRNAVVLRYFEQKPLADVGRALGVDADAAQKRVTRAVDKLRNFLVKRGLVLSAAAVAGVLGANAVQAAPTTLSPAIVGVVAAKGTAAAASAATLIKGTLKLMAWAKAKTAAVACVGLLVAGGAVTVVVESMASRAGDSMAGAVIVESKPLPADDSAYEEIFKDLDASFAAFMKNDGSAPQDSSTREKFEQLPPKLIVRPTLYSQGGMGFNTSSGKSVAVRSSMESMIRYAYGFTTPVRMILPKDLPSGQFDYLNTLTNRQQDALRAELKRQSGLVAHSEIRLTNVLVLKVKDPAKLQAHLVLNGRQKSFGSFKLSWGIPPGQITGFEGGYGLAEMLETICQKPVLDQTGKAAFYEFESEEESHLAAPGGSEEDSWRLKIAQLGLELVPGRESIAILVVEKVK